MDFSFSLSPLISMLHNEKNVVCRFHFIFSYHWIRANVQHDMRCDVSSSHESYPELAENVWINRYAENSTSISRKWEHKKLRWMKRIFTRRTIWISQMKRCSFNRISFCFFFSNFFYFYPAFFISLAFYFRFSKAMCWKCLKIMIFRWEHLLLFKCLIYLDIRVAQRTVHRISLQNCLFYFNFNVSESEKNVSTPKKKRAKSCQFAPHFSHEIDIDNADKNIFETINITRNQWREPMKPGGKLFQFRQYLFPLHFEKASDK